MDLEKNLQITAEDNLIEEAYQKYKSLKKLVNEWQELNGASFTEKVELSDKPPYLLVRNFPLDTVLNLWQKLNLHTNIKISDAELIKIWGVAVINENLANTEIDQELLMHLQMTISGLAQLVNEKVNNEDSNNIRKALVNDYREINCPVCGEIPAITALKPPNGNRVIHCLVCNNERNYRRSSCIYCDNSDTKKLMYLNNEIYPGIEVVACKECGQFFKEIDARHLVVDDYTWEDIRTLPLNFAAELWLKENVSHSKKVH